MHFVGVQDIAIQAGIHPAKLCDWNRYELGECNGTVSAGFALKVPRESCEAQAGAFSCYEVASADETLESIVRQHPSLRFRKDGLDALVRLNKDTLWAQTTVSPRMRLKIPVMKPCWPKAMLA